jgi:hypothetical protein
MGGGTTIVEALSLGRKAIGLDINALSHFVTTVKTTPLSENDFAAGISAGRIAASTCIRSTLYSGPRPSFKTWLLCVLYKAGPLFSFFPFGSRRSRR